MAKGRRNHYVPQLLLKRFASRMDGATAFVWQLSRDRAPKEIPTTNLAVESWFYGKGTGVEQALAKAETRYGAALAAIARGESPTGICNDLREFVWTTARRTRALREQMTQMGDELLASVVDWTTGTDEGQAEMGRRLLGDGGMFIDRLPKKKLRAMSARQLAAAEAELRRRYRALDLEAYGPVDPRRLRPALDQQHRRSGCPVQARQRLASCRASDLAGRAANCIRPRCARRTAARSRPG